MADTGIKKKFGPVKVSFERLSGYVILECAGQIMRLEKEEFKALESAVDWILIERDQINDNDTRAL